MTQAPQNPNFDKNVELTKNGSKLSHLKILKVFQILWLMMLSGEAVYGAPLMDKKASLEYMKGWHDAMENIKYTPDNYLPELILIQDRQERKNLWYKTGKNTASGKDFEVYVSLFYF